ncbi:MAG TPA: TonB-dependent receptor, partial [Candidatus Binataceae bacterium]|nr:TonB-dependent receptor [Candidatus Binataceae bacterium]
QRVFVRQDILDANPGRPGAPISIPGLPIETASGGIKAPQYFSPGVAGDHGEPIATYFQVGSYLVPNNLSANAHGNGYSDPNAIVPSTIESVQVDGGAFNVREGNHAVNLADIYGFHSRLEPFVALTGDYRDIDLTAGWSPASPDARAWIAIQASYGNGFLDTLEHRQQYKINGYRTYDFGAHELTLFGIGYYGQSKVPGLVPLGVPGLHDTIDPRQRDQTYTAEFAANDIWKLSSASELQLSSFFRSYDLSLYSNFGDGLIRQSEFRTVAGGNTNYVRKFSDKLSLMAGLDYLRDAPRRLDLDRYGVGLVTANNVTLTSFTPYIAVDGSLTPWLRYDLGWRRDQIDIDNRDLLHPEKSSQAWAGVNSPKATLNLIAPQALPLPTVAFSFGQAFFTNDPRIGNGTVAGTPVSRAHSLQMVLSKTVFGTDFRVTLGRVTQEQSLAKIDPDTGLQFDVGPSRNLFMTVAARHYFRNGMLQASVSKADARDLSFGSPIPEAPRSILDVLGTYDRLPFHLHARAEYEQVGSKPLGDGFRSVPVREFRAALARTFRNGRMEAGIHFLIASGYTGQTTEVLALPGEADPFERVVGVRLPSYVTASYTYHFR